MFLAHIRQSDFAGQTVQAHLEEVAWLARQYGNKIGLGAHAELAGFLHDMGKFTQHFTTYLKNAVIHQKVAKKKIDHSTAGAKYLYDRYYQGNALQTYVVETIGITILSHHSGLQNFVQPDLSQSDYLRRVTNHELPFYEEVVTNFEAIEGNVQRVKRLLGEAIDEFQLFMQNIKPIAGERPHTYLSQMQKFLFSCLIDADRTNTRCFEENESYTISDYQEIFETGYHTVLEQVKKWEQTILTPINTLRNDMSNECDLKANEPSSILKLSIPTGGGKTFASLRYALKHAHLHQKSRIIFVVPYTTILEQNAQAVRNIIQQSDAVLEHHANVIDDTALDDEQDYYHEQHHKQLQLGRDNWDYPIIFTTMVQFLDAFYQKGTRKARRLHNLTNAVIIFDEVQSVPFQHLPLFTTAINFLHAIGKSSILLCTATQPAIDHEKIEQPIILGETAEIIPNLNKVVKAFKRVSIKNQIEQDGWDAQQIAHFVKTLMNDHDSVLVILNTKSAVKKLYQVLVDMNIAHVVHLSTSMCPAHRSEKLKQIKNKLGKERIICVSTQLIEAGVDISFESVVRSLAGLDSIAQAAGRCNRHGELEQGHVYIIRAKDENLSKLPEIRIGGEITANYILPNPAYANDLLSPNAIDTYFRHFIEQANRDMILTPKGLDYKLISLLDGSVAAKMRLQTKSVGMFKTLEQHFEAISSPTKAVIVPYGEGEQIIASLNEHINGFKQFNELIKRAQQYSVNLYDHELHSLNNQRLIEPLYSESIFCLNKKAYHDEYGVALEGEAPMTPYQF